MTGITALTKLQCGRESTAGTAVAATTIPRWDGCYIRDDMEIYFPPENVGLLVDTDRACNPAKGASISVPENDATFEQILHILEMGIKTDTPAKDDAGDGYIYEYAFPTTAQLTPKTYTFEGGNDQDEYEVEYCHVTDFTLSGAVGQPLKFSANIVGRQASDTTFTESLTIPTVEEMLFQKCKFYISDVADGFGNDLLANTIIGFTLNVQTGYLARRTAGGNLYFSYLVHKKPMFTLDLSMEHNATAVAEIANGRALTARAVRMLCEGSEFSTGGTTYDNKSFILDLAGKYSAIPQVEDDDGVAIMNFTMQGGYNATLAQLGQITVVTDLSAVP